MVKTRQGGFEAIDEVFRRAQREAEERRSKHAESLTHQHTDEDRASRLVKFIVDCAEQESLLIVFNTATGQAVLKTCFRSEKRPGRRSTRYDWSGDFRRVSASEAARLLFSGERRAVRSCSLGSSLTYPQWLFEPTDEHVRDWLMASRLFSHEAYVGRIKNAREGVTGRVGDLLRFLQVLAIVAVMSVLDPKTNFSQPSSGG